MPQDYLSWAAFVACAMAGPAIGMWRRASAEKSPALSGATTTSLRGSVAPLDRHVIVCTGTGAESWPARLEDDGASLLSRLSKAVSECNNQKPATERKLRIKITASDAASTLPGFTDCIVYPEATLVRVHNNDSIATLAAALTVDPKQGPLTFPSSVPYPHKLMLICSHMQRDKRCGKVGPLVVSRAKEMINGEDDVRVMASSHIGGHEFAGTLIAYPRGDWYGHVTTQRVPEILGALEAGPSCALRCFRGNSFDW